MENSSPMVHIFEAVVKKAWTGKVGQSWKTIINKPLREWWLNKFFKSSHSTDHTSKWWTYKKSNFRKILHVRWCLAVSRKSGWRCSIQTGPSRNRCWTAGVFGSFSRDCSTRRNNFPAINFWAINRSGTRKGWLRHRQERKLGNMRKEGENVFSLFPLAFRIRANPLWAINTTLV